MNKYKLTLTFKCIIAEYTVEAVSEEKALNDAIYQLTEDHMFRLEVVHIYFKHNPNDYLIEEIV